MESLENVETEVLCCPYAIRRLMSKCDYSIRQEDLAEQILALS
jgi:hypothetical protein